MRKVKRDQIIIFTQFIIIVFLMGYILFGFYQRREKISLIIIDKEKLKLLVLNNDGDTIKNFPVAVGTNKGNKQKPGDLKTPEGAFFISSIESSSSWTYDFEDDSSGPVKGAYGPWFIRLDVKKHKGIGIHGTHDSSTIGKRVSHGCIRMKNDDLVYLVSKIHKGIPVMITEDKINGTE